MISQQSSVSSPVGWVGANFWSRTGGPLMWRHYDADVVTTELGVLREHGMNVTRSFLYRPDFMPGPDELDETCVERFADFLDRHVAADMRTIPTFIVGHMSGANWDPPWRQGRDLYRDAWMLARQAWYIREVAARFRDHPAIAGWVISNEMPLYGGSAPTDVVTAWAELMVQAVRAAGAMQPVSIGDGAWGIEITGQDNGYSLRALSRLVDFLGPHSYPMGDDPVRQHLAAAFVCELAGFTGKPVVLEEFGVTTDFVSAENACHYYRQVLHNTLLAGATGWLAWNNTDYDHLYAQDPYRHHPFEMHFGLTDAEGRPKPHLHEVRAFADLLERIDLPGCHRPRPEAALVVPSYLECAYPFTDPGEAPHIAAVLQQAYVVAREADLAVELLRERDGLGPDRRLLYLVPSAKQLTAPAWRELRRFADDGAVVYVSYSPGPNAWQRGPWYADLDGMFGVEHQLAYGLVDPIEDEVVTATFVRGLGGIPGGTRLTFRTAGNEHARAFLPVRPVDAQVVATDQHDRPLLLQRTTGAGRLVLCTYPLEHMAALTPRVNPEPTHRIYDALADLAGVRRHVTVSDPRVLAATLEHHDGRRFAWLVSQADAPITVKPTVDGSLHDLVSGEAHAEIDLSPFGVRVLELRRAARPNPQLSSSPLRAGRHTRKEEPAPKDPNRPTPSVAPATDHEEGP